jgi:dCTP deaminase
LDKNRIIKLLESGDLVFRPLLDIEQQVGQITVDLRLGTDFLISYQGRKPYIDATSYEQKLGSIKDFFLPHRRKFGDEIILHPHQTILCSSLEYVKLPENVFAILSMRSTYSRLGLTISTLIQAGYCGCVSIELTNANNNPIRVAVGARIFQARLFYLSTKVPYSYNTRKYVAQVRPIPADVDDDKDLVMLKRIYEQNF